MVWFSEDFYWLGAKNNRENSIHLHIDDGCKIELDMDDCAAETYLNCLCESCGYNSYCSRTLSLDELKDLHQALGNAILYCEEHEARLK